MTRFRLTDEELAELELLGAEIGEVVEIATGATVQADGLPLTLADAVRDPDMAAFGRFEAPNLHQSGLFVERSTIEPRLFRFSPRVGNLELRRPPGGAMGRTEGSVLAFLDPALPTWAVLDSIVGEGAILGRGRLADLAVPVVVPESPLPIVDVEAWMHSGVSAWVARRARELQDGTAYERALAVGLFVRFVGPEDPVVAVRRAIEGERIPELAGPREWAMGLDVNALQEIERQALAEAEILQNALRVVDAGVEGAAGWLVRLARRRDDLDAVLMAVSGGGPRPNLVAAVRRLDGLATTHLATMRWCDEHPQIAEAAAVYDDAWWFRGTGLA